MAAWLNWLFTCSTTLLEAQSPSLVFMKLPPSSQRSGTEVVDAPGAASSAGISSSQDALVVVPEVDEGELGAAPVLMMERGPKSRAQHRVAVGLPPDDPARIR